MPESSKLSGQAVRKLRMDLGLKQMQLALRADIAESTLIHIEVHGYVPKESLQKRIAKALGVRRRDLWPDEDDELETVAQ